MPRLELRITKEQLLQINEVKKKENITTWAKTANKLIMLGIQVYNNQTLKEFSGLLLDIKKEIHNSNNFQIRMIARLDKVLNNKDKNNV